MERARVLCNDIQLPTQRAEGPSINAMAMRRTEDIRSSFVNRTMNHEGGRIQQSHLTTVDDLPLMIHLNEIALFDEGEGNTERVDPESARVNWIAQRDVPSDALIVAIFAFGFIPVSWICSIKI